MLNHTRIPFYRYLSWLACLTLVFVAGDSHLQRSSGRIAGPTGATDCGTRPLAADERLRYYTPSSQSQSGLPTPDPAATLLLQQALTTTQALTHYEYRYTLEDPLPGLPQFLHLTGAVVTTDTGYVQSQDQGNPLEVMVLHETALRKQDGRWTAQRIHESFYAFGQLPPLLTDLIEGPSLTWYKSRQPSNIRPLTAVYSYVRAACGVQVIGMETLERHAVQHLTFQIDPMAAGRPYTGNIVQWPPTTKLSPTMGTGEAWVDPASGYIHQLSLSLDRSLFGGERINPFHLRNITSTMTSLPGQPIMYQIVLTRHNDPTLQMPPVDIASAYRPSVNIQQAIATMAALQSYRYQIETKFEQVSDPGGQRGNMSWGPTRTTAFIKIEGAVAAPHQGYARVESTDPQQQREELVRGNEVYTRTLGSAPWGRATELDRQPGRVTTMLDLAELIQTLLGTSISFASHGAGDNLKWVGVQEYPFQIINYRRQPDGTLATLAGTAGGHPIGDGTLTLDAQTHYIHRIRFSVTLPGDEGTPGLPGIWLPPAMNEVTITFSQHNDPAITLPTP